MSWPASTNASRVIAILKDYGPSTIQRLRRLLPDVQAVDQVTWQLTQAGKIARIRKGVYGPISAGAVSSLIVLDTALNAAHRLRIKEMEVTT